MTVCSDTPPLVRIFIGEPLQHRSEYDCLIDVCTALAQTSGWAYIFANFHVAGRQLDFVVFTKTTTVAIEVKGYSLPVRGEINGQWEQLGPYGARNIGNAYNQALNAKNALRDEIQLSNQIDGYPNGLVVVTPGIPKGSTLTSGDFKVVITGLGQIARELKRPSGAILTQGECESLARRLRLEEVGSANAALDEEVFVAERENKVYVDAFRDFHGPIAAALVGDRYTYGEEQIGLPEVQALVLSGSSGVLISGPSGCGKTMLATSCAMSCLDAGCIPIFVAGGNFEGDFQRLLDKEAALLGVRSASRIIKTAKLLGKRLFLFLDGYNECPDDSKLTLTRGLRAFSLRYDARIVVSTQQDIVRPNLLETQNVTVSRPSDKLKASLAKIAQADPAGNLHSLLQVTNSGLEAALVGQVGTTLPVGSSRFGLFDTYARTRLGVAASEGIRVLATIAETLIHRACFSLSVREFDRLCDSAALVHLDRQQLVRVKLLYLRGDRISFVHELFFSAFSAEAAIRSANGDVQRIRSALESPRFFSSKAFILGAVEDDRVLHDVLECISDHALLTACSQGECGASAQSIVKRKITKMLDDMVSEAQDLDFQFIGEGWHGADVVLTSLHCELRDFGSYLGAICSGLKDGQYLDAVMAACRKVDDAILNFTTANVAAAKIRKIPLRHGLFSAAYVMHRDAAISQLVNFVHSGGLSLYRDEGPGFGPAIRDAWQRAASPGQFYFLIGLTKFAAQNKDVAPHVARLLNDIGSYPYHLQLDLIDFAQYLRDAEEPYRTQIIHALQASLDKLGAMMNSIIFEALNALGALEEEEQSYVPVIREEIQSALDSEGPESDLTAWALFSCQFDHPFDSVYWDEIQALDEERKKRLLMKACRGADGRYSSFLGILIRQLSEFGDPNVAPAIIRWTVLPDKMSFMPQDAVDVFVNAHQAFGRLEVELPLFRGEETNEADSALLACGELFYWASRADVQDVETSINTLVARSTLLERCRHTASGALKLTSSWLLSADGTRASLVKKYPAVSVEICKGAIERRSEQASYFERGFNSDSDSIACFAIQVLGAAGSVDDLAVLRNLCDDEQCGTSSLNAIKKIEERHHFLHD